jgi:hypothetical protein
MAVTPTQTFLTLVRGSAVLLIVAACENRRFGYCSAPYSPAVIVTPLDSGTRTNVAVGARGVALSGTYVDSLRRVDSVLWGGAQLGTYQVTVERLGYHQWVRNGVQVTQATECGMPVSVRLTALLQPTP